MAKIEREIMISKINIGYKIHKGDKFDFDKGGKFEIPSIEIDWLERNTEILMLLCLTVPLVITMILFLR